MKNTKKSLLVTLALLAIAFASLAAYRSPEKLTLPVVREHNALTVTTPFYVIAGNQKVELNWRGQEANLHQFILERDGQIIARMPAYGVNQEFQFTDKHLANDFEYNYALYNLAESGERNLLGSQSATPNRVREIAAKFTLEQNYPNPFNPRTTIAFDLPEQSMVRLTVYNSLGQAAAILADGVLSAGRHSVTFDGTALASGIYLYELQAGSFSEIRKMVLVK